MAAETKIEWCDSTWNPWIGCTKVSPACDHCYAEVSTPARTLHIEWGARAERRRTSPANWSQARRWNAQHEAFFAVHGRRRRVFTASLADVFDNAVPTAWREDLFRLIVDTPNLDWLMLTKRIGNVRNLMPENIVGGELPRNVWLGSTICNQEEADRDIPKLLAAPARVRFLSMEPLLGPVVVPFDSMREWNRLALLNRQEHAASRIDWVIVGGESGAHARPMHPRWASDIRDQCEEAGVPFLFKQWGEWKPAEFDGDKIVVRFENADETGPDEPKWFDWPGGQLSVRVGKKAAGRLLDGAQHDGFPGGEQ